MSEVWFWPVSLRVPESPGWRWWWTPRVKGRELEGEGKIQNKLVAASQSHPPECSAAQTIEGLCSLFMRNPSTGPAGKTTTPAKRGAMGCALQHCLWSTEEAIRGWLTSATHTSALPLAQTPCSPSKFLTVIWLPEETLLPRREYTDQLTALNIPEFTQLSVSWRNQMSGLPKLKCRP